MNKINVNYTVLRLVGGGDGPTDDDDEDMDDDRQA